MDDDVVTNQPDLTGLRLPDVMGLPPGDVQAKLADVLAEVTHPTSSVGGYNS